MKKIIFFLSVIVSVVLLTSCNTDKTSLELAPLFTNNMVLQANEPVNIWGTAHPKTKVTVTFRDQTHTVKADADGKWLLTLNSEDYGEPALLKVNTKTHHITLQNVLVGEVWLCSGQSNMEMPMLGNWAHLNNARAEVADAQKYPDIRLFTVEKNIAFQPIDTIGTQGWLVCDSSSVKNFSATAYFFGRKLYNELQVPIGLIHSSWGGTVAEAWTSKNSLIDLDDFEEATKKIASLNESKDSLEKKYEKDKAIMHEEILMADPGYQEGEAVFAQIDTDDSDWMPIDLPKMWEETALGNYDGSTWFRKEITLNAQEANNGLTLYYGAPDDYDKAWFNGVKVGEKESWGDQRIYKIPEGVAKKGKNVITLRVYDYTGGGGFMGEPSQYKLVTDAGRAIPIAKGWVAKKGFDFKNIETIPVSLDDPNQATVLYNAMINPLIPFTFKGAIWYQGESNAGRAYQYQTLFKTMIKDWRKNFTNGDFPFYFVQLANYMTRNSQPVDDTWAELREAQTMALDLPNTGMAVTIDIGDAKDIHPGNKQDVGKRLALNALAKTYNKKLEYMGPLYKGYSIKGNSVTLDFDFNQELKTSDGKPLVGFSIAGSDSTFVWAKAKVEGNKVVVYHPNIKKPLAVRYGWSSNPACNLTNRSGLPASPFRTDSWKGITE